MGTGGSSVRLMGRPEMWLHSRWWQRAACAVAVAVLPAAWIAIGPAHPARADTQKTVVSLTFDDADADQMTAAKIMRKYGLHGTFYVITSAVGTPTYMTMSDLRTLAATGNEIGDHTVSHLSMPKISLAEARRQACGGRNILTSWGFRVTDFAYPDARYTRPVENVVRECGLNSARIGNGIRNGQCPGCAAAEKIPPRDPDAVRTPGQIDTSWTVTDMERAVTNAEENGGGWVPFVFHHICQNPKASNCSNLSISPAHFAEFARWLATHQKHGAHVETVAKVIGGRDHPEVHTAAASPHGVQNASLTGFGQSVSVSTENESTNDVTGPTCWMYGGYGENKVRWQRIPGGHDSPYAERATMTKRVSGDAKLLQQFDTGQCSLQVTPGKAYQLTSWYTSTARTQYALYYRTASGRWVYWTSSPYFRPSSGWARAQWQTPPVPSGATGLSFGLDLPSVGSLTTSGYQFASAPVKAGVLIFRIVVLTGVCALVARIVYAGIRRIRRRRSARAMTSGPQPPTTPHIAGASRASARSSSKP
jgi:peptidoglycan/xylan/chitin deacetylase (PgdA/CDA1 family)